MIDKEINKKSNLKSRGITLVVLVVTIVVLIILATISINIIFGEEGILNRVQQGKQEMANAQEEEKEILADTANSIDGYVVGERETTDGYNEPIGLTDSLAKISYSSTENVVTAGTRTLKDFTSSLSIENEKYLKLNTTTNNIEIQEDGWYIINIDVHAYYNTEGLFDGNLIINGKKIYLGITYLSTVNQRDKIGKCVNIYLKKGDTVNFEINTAGNFTWYILYMDIYAN